MQIYKHEMNLDSETQLNKIIDNPNQQLPGAPYPSYPTTSALKPKHLSLIKQSK